MVRLVIRVVVALALVGIVVHEGGQVLFAQTKADDIAQDAAQTGADIYSETKSHSQARAGAAAEVADRGARLRSFTVLPDGKARLRVVVTASTLIIRRVSFLRRFGVRRATVTAGPPPL
ncbi:MAG TPA: hypothetical protein VHI97_01990 [Actinomycetota bacterium]|nr:hypothetical protein [Actinomycetota bacterium]